MEYPRLAREWHPARSAESTADVSVGESSRAAAFTRHHNEQTESREELARSRHSDPESTEEILEAKKAARDVRPAGTAPDESHGAVVAARLTGLSSASNGRKFHQEITHPIDLSHPAHAPSFGVHTRFPVHVAVDEEDSAELVELVLGGDEFRSSVGVGETLAGRYTVLEEVDHSGMGVVYKALDRRREQAGMATPWVALKFARPATGEGTSTATYLRQEFLKLSQLNHPNIVSVFDFDSDGGLDFIVMEWLDGETLASLLTQITSKRIALYKAEEIVRGIGSALAHAHELGVVHGDVKPSNIFVTENKMVKLLDFGSSMEASADGGEGNWATRAYASCEILRGAGPQPHDDVYALGVTAYCLLSGERPFGELDAVEARERGVVPEPLPADAERCWPAIEHALRLDACDRPADAREFLMELDDRASDPAAPDERTHLERIAYGAVAALLLIALVAWTVGSIGGISDPEQVALDRAEAAFEEGRLMAPGDDSAFHLFSSVLQTSPEHPAALDGLERITEHYLGQARAALEANEPESALDSLDAARQVMPDHYGIAITGDLIDRYGKDLLAAALQVAETDLGQAERMLLRASAFLPGNDPALVELRAQLDRLRTEADLGALLAAIDERILAERLAIPRGDSAIDLLRKARELAPDDRQVMLAADRIATALLFQSMFAISSGKLDDAARFIEGAKSLNVKHLALSRAEYELAKARHEAMRTRSRAN